jgi:hypothetical protein
MDDFPLKQGKFKVDVILADGLGCLLLKTFKNLLCKWGSLAKSAWANPMNF